MKCITLALAALAITLAAASQNRSEEAIAKLVKKYHSVPSRELVNHDPETGEMTFKAVSYHFQSIKEKDLTALQKTMREEAYAVSSSYENSNETQQHVFTFTATVPNYRSIYQLLIRGGVVDIHSIYEPIPVVERKTNFYYTPGTYYNIVNKLTGAKLGLSFDYKNHACAYHSQLPEGKGPDGIIINPNKVLRFRLEPVKPVNKSIDKEVCEDCYIITEDRFALTDASNDEEGQWIIFRYLNKQNLCQRWGIIEHEGTVTIINRGTGRCIDLAGGETKEGAAVFSYDINEDKQSNTNQKWNIVVAESIPFK